MEDLLKLLFSNIYVVIIIAGFLLTLLNKARGKQKPGGNRMPPFGGGPAGRPQTRPLAERPPQPERPAPLQAKPRPTVSPAAASPMGGGSLYTSQLPSSSEGASMELAESGVLARSLEAERLAAVQPKLSAGMAAANSRPRPSGNGFRTPRGQELRQAFIMAEVLGPPRSKRPLKQK